jgi:hypothetical protein
MKSPRLFLCHLHQGLDPEILRPPLPPATFDLQVFICKMR